MEHVSLPAPNASKKGFISFQIYAISNFQFHFFLALLLGLSYLTFQGIKSSLLTVFGCVSFLKGAVLLFLVSVWLLFVLFSQSGFFLVLLKFLVNVVHMV